MYTRIQSTGVLYTGIMCITAHTHLLHAYCMAVPTRLVMYVACSPYLQPACTVPLGLQPVAPPKAASLSYTVLLPVSQLLVCMTQVMEDLTCDQSRPNPWRHLHAVHEYKYLIPWLTCTICLYGSLIFVLNWVAVCNVHIYPCSTLSALPNHRPSFAPSPLTVLIEKGLFTLPTHPTR